MANSDAMIAAKARLEALASLSSTTPPEYIRSAELDELESNPLGFRLRLRRLAYSSVMKYKSPEEARKIFTNIFTSALIQNPQKLIGGILYYDENTGALVQVLEGPAAAVSNLFHHRIAHDPRHTAVKKLWDVVVQERIFDGFGMKVGSELATAVPKVLSGEGSGQEAALITSSSHKLDLIRLTYTSKLLVASRSRVTAYRMLQEILRSAIVNNQRASISGVLFLNPDSFQILQVLEGPPDAVRALFNTISKDLRHENCVMLSDERVGERSYSDWGMVQGELVDWTEMNSGEWTGEPLTSSHEADAYVADVFADADAASSASAASATTALLVGAAADVSTSEAQTPAPRAAAAEEAEEAAASAPGTEPSIKERSWSFVLPWQGFRSFSIGSEKSDNQAHTKQVQQVQQPGGLPRAVLEVGAHGPSVRWESSVSVVERKTERDRAERLGCPPENEGIVVM